MHAFTFVHRDQSPLSQMKLQAALYTCALHLWDQGLKKKAAPPTKTHPARLQLNTDTSEQFAEVFFFFMHTFTISIMSYPARM